MSEHENNNIVVSTERKNFTMVDKEIVVNKNLSLKSKGLYLVLKSYSTLTGWRFNRKHLISLCTDGKASFDSAIKELKKNGLLTIKPNRTDSGKLEGWIWMLHDIQNYAENELPETGNTGNQELNNNSESSNTNSNKTDEKIKDVAEPEKSAPVQRISFNFSRKKFEGIEREDLELWADTYPDVDIVAELKKMREWCIANPQKIKPRQVKGKRGLRATVINWLNREQGKFDAQLNYHRARSESNGRYYN